MNPDELQAREDRIVEQCKKRIGEGWTIAEGTLFSARSKRCCALGAFVEPDDGLGCSDAAYHLASERAGFGEYGVPARAFAYAFDVTVSGGAVESYFDEPECTALGVRVAKRLGVAK